MHGSDSNEGTQPTNSKRVAYKAFRVFEKDKKKIFSFGKRRKTLEERVTISSRHTASNALLGFSEELPQETYDQIGENWKNFEINKYILKAGDSGRYQWLIFLNSILVLFAASFTVYGISYMMPTPIGQCLQDQGGKKVWVQCPEAKACSLRKSGLGKLKWGVEGNWTEKYGYYCDGSYLRTLSLFFLLVISTILCFILLSSADKIGRKKIMFIASINIIAGVTLCLLSPSLIVKMVCLGIGAGSEGAFSSLFGILINESSLPETKLRSSLIAGSFVAYGLGSLSINVVTLWIPGVNWIVYIAGFLIYLSTIPGFFSYEETPKYLHRHGNLTEMIESLHSIAKFNKKKNITEFDFYEPFVDRQTYEVIKSKKIMIEVQAFELEEAEVTQESKKLELEKDSPEGTKKGLAQSISHEVGAEEESAGDESSIKQIFTSKKYIFQYIALSLSAGVSFMVLYGLTTSIQQLGLEDIHYNGLLLGFTQSLGYLICLPLAHKMKRKKWSIIFQVLVLLGALILGVLSKITAPGNPHIQLMKTIMSTFWMATLNSAQFPILYTYINELFPVKIRGLANALILFTAKLMGALAPIFGALSTDMGFHLLFGCSFFVIFSLPVSFLIKETFVEPVSQKGDKVIVVDVRDVDVA